MIRRGNKDQVKQLDEFALTSGWFGAERHSGKIYFIENTIAMCSNSDISSVSNVKAFGLLGLLLPSGKKLEVVVSEKISEEVNILAKNDNIKISKIIPIDNSEIKAIKMIEDNSDNSKWIEIKTDKMKVIIKFSYGIKSAFAKLGWQDVVF